MASTMLARAGRKASARSGFALPSSAAALPGAAAASRVARSGNAGGYPVLGSTSTKRQLFGRAFNAACRPLSTHSSHVAHSGADNYSDDREVGRNYFNANAKDLRSDEAIWALYHGWCQHFKIERSHEEMTRRFDTFKKTAWYVQGARDVTTWSVRPGNVTKRGPFGLNNLADTPLEELKPKLPVSYEQYLQAGEYTFSDED